MFTDEYIDNFVHRCFSAPISCLSVFSYSLLSDGPSPLQCANCALPAATDRKQPPH